MHCKPRMSNQWKWLISSGEIWHEKVVWKIAIPEPVHSGRCAGITGSFKFDENI